VMNYGLYKKQVFREIGMYNLDYQYYYADADMAERSYAFGYKAKTLRKIKVCSLDPEKRAIHYPDDQQIFLGNLEQYKKRKLSLKSIPFLE
jgi:hypothetical protein